jgi:hypothetical protein
VTGANQPEAYSFNGTDVVTGLFDRRQNLNLSPVTLDISALRQVVDDRANPAGTDLTNTYWNTNPALATFNPRTDWNGVVYVEFPTVAAAPRPANDLILPAQTTGSSTGTGGPQNLSLALQIINGEFIPSPSFSPEPGLTLATNAPAYMVGRFNASATDTNSVNVSTNHYKTWTGGNLREPPAAIMSDSYTQLSEQWAGTTGNRIRSDNAAANTRPIAASVPVSAAILTGLTPTIPSTAISSPAGGAQSGGAHNFPRFLEVWGGQTFHFRTSMVALFVSEVHRQPMPANPGYYSPPARNFGFSQNFSNGVFPPGTPTVRMFRRGSFQDITQAEYDAATVTP